MDAGGYFSRHELTRFKGLFLVTMNITPQDLAKHLKQQPRNTFIYLITGDEILLVEESIHHISTQARTEGYEERHVIESETADAMDRFLSHTQNLSFLSSKKIIEVRLLD